MYKVVLDTNVLVSALWSEHGNPYRILEMFLNGEITLHYNDEIFEEYYEVLHRDKLGFSENKVLSLLLEIKENGIYIDALKSNNPFIDEDDRKNYDTANACGAILVTGNKKHYPQEPFILSPTEFIEGLDD
jgi:putative PIN family toxin of toxin-antitoxin system